MSLLHVVVTVVASWSVLSVIAGLILWRHVVKDTQPPKAAGLHSRKVGR